MTVGAEAVRQHVGVAPVGLVAGRAVALAKGLDRPARDDHDLEAGVHERVDDRPVGSFDRDSCDPAEPTAEFNEPIGGVLDVELGDDATVGVDDADGVGVGGPVHPAVAGRGIMHVSLLAVAAVGKHPVVHGRVCRSLTDRRSLALSPVASRHVLGRRSSQNSRWRSDRKRARRWTNGHQGCTSSLTATGTPMVDQ